MKVKSKDLTGRALDYAVAISEGHEVVIRAKFLRDQGITLEAALTMTPAIVIPNSEKTHPMTRLEPLPSYCERWDMGGPIMDDNEIRSHGIKPGIECWIPHKVNKVTGPNLLVAGMRCYVTLKLGEEVEIPEELL